MTPSTSPLPRRRRARRFAGAFLGFAVGTAGAGCFDAGEAPETGGSGETGTAGTETGGASGTGSGTSTSASSGTSTTTGPSSTSGDPTGGGVDPADPCPDLPPPPPDAVFVTPADVGDLPSMIAGAAPGTTFVLEPGTYDLPAGYLYALVTVPMVIRGATGDPNDVVLDAGAAVDEVFQIAASGVTIAELSIENVVQNAVHVTPPDGVVLTDVRVYDVQVRDCGKSCIKANASPARTGFADAGEVACSRVEMTDAFRATAVSCTNAGGIDLLAVRDWVVRDNWVEGFFCPASWAFPGVTIHGASRDVVVERNRVVDCSRGIYMGAEVSGGSMRTYPDDPCPGKEAALIGGVARNNVVVGKRPELFMAMGGFDTGLGLIAACGTKALHNTIASANPDPNSLYASIDARFEATDAVARNNLATHAVKIRDGATLDDAEGNVPMAQSDWFVDLLGGDVHLAAGAPAIDAGVPLAGDEAVPTDLDGEPRDDGIPDAGADEFRTDG